MSVIAQRWAYSRRIGNPSAKAILAFLASHNFGGDQSCFRIKTIAAATDLSIRTVQNGIEFLLEKGYLKKEARFAESGQQLANEYTLNIPKDYVDSCYAQYGEPSIATNSVDNSTRGGATAAPPPAAAAPSPLQQLHPLNNKSLNNNINKEKAFINKGGKTVDKSPLTGNATKVSKKKKSNEMSDEAINAKRGDRKVADYYMSNMRGINLKRNRKNNEQAIIN